MREFAFYCQPLPWVACFAAFAFVGSVAADDFSDALQAVRKVEKDGIGHAAAVEAMKVLNQAPAEKIPAMLEAMDGVNGIALNWFRGAIQQVAQRSEQLPMGQIKAYFSDTTHHPMGRLLAFELITADRNELREGMIPTLIDDPSMPLRRMAVERLIDEAKQLSDEKPEQAITKLSVALGNARDVEQIQTLAKLLAEFNVQVDLQRQLGFLPDWKLVGTFDNKDMKGFDLPQGPESNVEQIDLAHEYSDAAGDRPTWRAITTGDSLGNVDLNDIIGPEKGAIVYAYATFDAQAARDAQFRIGTPNATKIWLNGELVMSNEVYHNSNSVDKFVGDVKLKEGTNEILIKVCQNEQTESWAQDWLFQFRICDKNGKAILPADG